MVLREGALQLQEENLALREQAKALQERLGNQTQLSYENGAYWRRGEEQRDGPFCQRCFDAEGLVVRVHHQNDRYWHCIQCDNTIPKGR